MLFIHPMWDNESERIGKQKCTPVGYAIHVFADLLGFIGLLLLLGLVCILPTRELPARFVRLYLLWLLTVPFGVGVVSELLFQFSWRLAGRKNFRYDYESREATWIDAGEPRSYKWKA